MTRTGEDHSGSRRPRGEWAVDLYAGIQVARRLRNVREYDDPVRQSRNVATELRDLLVRHEQWIADDAYEEVRSSLDALVGPTDGLLRVGIDDELDESAVVSEVERIATRVEALYLRMALAAGERPPDRTRHERDAGAAGSDRPVDETDSQRTSRTNSSDSQQGRATEDPATLERRVLATVRADEDPSEDLDALRTELETAPERRRARAALALVRLTQMEGAGGCAAAHEVLGAVAGALDESEPRLVRKRAALVIVELAETHRVGEILPALTAALADDDNETVQKRAALALYYESDRVRSRESTPDPFGPVLNRFIGALDDDVPAVRSRSALVLDNLADRAPSLLVHLVEEVAQAAVATSDHRVRVRLCRALRAVVVADPAAVAAVRPSLEALWSHHSGLEPLRTIVNETLAEL